jgi:cytochrome c oxidase cbb3-type subunit II
MRHGALIFLGVFSALALSWYGMILVPQIQMGRNAEIGAGPTAIRYPLTRPGGAQQGREVYRVNGCYYCHTQQVRPQGTGADLDRNWGIRFSVAQDYLLDQPIMLGSLRAGPDLANIGARVPRSMANLSTTPETTNQVSDLPDWHLRHLYNPRITAPGSTMPQYGYLFEKVRRHKNSPVHSDALKLPEQFAPKPSGDYTYDIVPKHDARILVDYLLSMKTDLALFESPIPAPPVPAGATNQTGATNGVAGTNAPTTNTPTAPAATAPPK